MNKTVTSKYIQINDYLLLEYRYAGPADADIGNSFETWRIRNNVTDTYQFINGDNAIDDTGNIADWSSSKYEENTWALHDTTNNENLLGTEYYDLDEQAITGDTYYDKVKVHILSGFTFDGIDGLITEVIWPEKSTKDFVAANYVQLYDTQVHFSTKPLFLGERYYNRYFEFMVPSLYAVQQEWLAASDKSGSFAGNYSFPIVPANPNPAGYAKDAMVYVNVHEITAHQEQDVPVTGLPDVKTVTMLHTTETYSASFNMSDEYKPLSAHIGESSNGDFFEYFGMWNNEFIDDYIEKMNSASGGDWAIINEINVFEHIGTDIIETSNFTSLQENNFDAPNLFRPIIGSADSAFAFSVDYTMRLIDRVSNEQIIRKSSVTSYEPKKYGRDLIRIDVDEGFRPIKVYNKILSNVFESMAEVKEPLYKTRFVKNYIQNFNISLQSRTDFGRGVADSIYGQGEAPIFLTPYDNVLRFKVLVKSKDTDDMIPLNMEMSAIYLTFEHDIRVEAESIPGLSKLNGDLQFTINQEMSRKLLLSAGESFYIVSQDFDGDLETVVYKGSYFDFSDYGKVNDSILTDIRVREERDLEKYSKDYRNLEELNKVLQERLRHADRRSDNKTELSKGAFEKIKLLEHENTIKDSIISDGRQKIKGYENIIVKPKDEEPVISPPINWLIRPVPVKHGRVSTMDNNVFDPTLKSKITKQDDTERQE